MAPEVVFVSLVGVEVGTRTDDVVVVGDGEDTTSQSSEGHSSQAVSHRRIMVTQ